MQNKKHFHKDVTVTKKKIKNSSLLHSDTAWACNNGIKPEQNISEHRALGFLLNLLLLLKEIWALQVFMWPKRGCNSQTKHSASSSKQVMCRTCSLCVLIMERALIQNNFPAGDKKKKGGKNGYEVVFSSVKYKMKGMGFHSASFSWKTGMQLMPQINFCQIPV